MVIGFLVALLAALTACSDPPRPPDDPRTACIHAVRAWSYFRPTDLKICARFPGPYGTCPCTTSTPARPGPSAQPTVVHPADDDDGAATVLMMTQ